MISDCNRDKMAIAAIEKSKCYAINSIYDNWEKTFNTIKKELDKYDEN